MQAQAQAQAGQWFRCTYTKHLTQKHKVFQDGLVLFAPHRKLTLFALDEGGDGAPLRREIDAIYVPPQRAVHEGCERLEFNSFLVDMDAQIQADAVPPSAAPTEPQAGKPQMGAARRFAALKQVERMGFAEPDGEVAEQELAAGTDGAPSALSEHDDAATPVGARPRPMLSFGSLGRASSQSSAFHSALASLRAAVAGKPLPAAPQAAPASVRPLHGKFGAKSSSSSSGGIAAAVAPGAFRPPLQSMAQRSESVRLGIAQGPRASPPPPPTPSPSPGDASGLIFTPPSLTEATVLPPLPVPNAFGSVADYKRVFMRNLLIEINAQLASLSGAFARAYRAAQSQDHVHRSAEALQAYYRAQRVPFYHCDFLELIRSGGRAAKKRSRNWQQRADLVKLKRKWKLKQMRQRAQARMRRAAGDDGGEGGGGDEFEEDVDDCEGLDADDDDDDDDDEDDAEEARRGAENSTKRGEEDEGGEGTGGSAVRFFLKISAGQEHSSVYAKDDLWVLSSSPSFDASGRHFVAFARAVFHGPGSQGLLQVDIMSGRPAGLTGVQRVFALRGPNLTSELAMIDVLNSLSPARVPIMGILLGGGARGFAALARERVVGGAAAAPEARRHFQDLRVEQTRARVLAADVCSEFALNEDQRAVLMRVVSWFLPAACSSAAPESCAATLVHGTFGAGKSFLLVAVIVFLCRVLSEVDPEQKVRILVAAQTNVAVDRVLLGLQERGFTSFTRVGSVRKIAKPILPHVLHFSRAGASAEDHDALAIREMQAMLRTSNPTDRLCIERALADLKAQRSEKRAQMLRQQRVVGATCLATLFPIMAGNKFSVCILDECSQMIEPLSLLPLARFGTERFLAVGDPRQLPPTLVSVPESSFGGDARGTADDRSLSKALFVRLAADFPPIMLRTQYRCHPALTALPNALFYGGRLLDGVSPSQRPPVLSQLPPLVFCDVRGGQEASERWGGGSSGGGGGSLYNDTEARAVGTVLGALLGKGIEPGRIGVISLYHAQRKRLQLAVDRLCGPAAGGGGGSEGDDEEAAASSASGSVHVATVDAFQGGERDVIVLSTVRTRGAAFINSPQRINVALTRARRHLIIFGSMQNLQGDALWGRIVAHIGKAPWTRVCTPDQLAGLVGASALLAEPRAAAAVATPVGSASLLREPSPGVDDFEELGGSLPATPALSEANPTPGAAQLVVRSGSLSASSSSSSSSSASSSFTSLPSLSTPSPFPAPSLPLPPKQEPLNLSPLLDDADYALQ